MTAPSFSFRSAHSQPALIVSPSSLATDGMALIGATDSKGGGRQSQTPRGWKEIKFDLWGFGVLGTPKPQNPKTPYFSERNYFF